MTTTTKTRPTLEQRRAAHAWSFIEHVSKNRKLLIPDKSNPASLKATDQDKKLGTEIKKLSTRIIASGLGQAITFLHAKEAAPLLEQVISQWLLNDRPEKFNEQLKSNGKDLIDKIIHSSSANLRDQTEEALAYLPWLSRFAEAVGLMDKPDDNQGEN